MNKEEAYKIAEEYLTEGMNIVQGKLEFLPDEDGFYFYQPNPGGAQIIVAVDGSFLVATSHVGPVRLTDEFHQGKRSHHKLNYF